MAMSREIVEQILHAGREGDVEGFVRLMAPNGCIEWPYRPPDVPARIQGREEIRVFLNRLAHPFIKIDEHRGLVTHETTDPEVVIVEYDAYGTVVATGAPFHQTTIAVFRVRDGHVVSYRDYINPLPLMEALAGVGRTTA
jgi:uncharacterized protein